MNISCISVCVCNFGLIKKKYLKPLSVTTALPSHTLLPLPLDQINQPTNRQCDPDIPHTSHTHTLTTSSSCPMLLVGYNRERTTLETKTKQTHRCSVHKYYDQKHACCVRFWNQQQSHACLVSILN